MSVGDDVNAGGGGGREVKIFVSSPGDVVAERQRLQRVVDRLNGRMGGSVHFRTIRWEENFYRSRSTFQDQIEQAVACDIVVSIFWTRLGTELPPDFADKLPDGRPYPSGTAYEVLTALEASRTRPLPDVYVFKKSQPALYPSNEAEAEAFETQVKRLGAFWKEWFVSAAGHFRAAFNSFGTTDEFESQIEKLLSEWLETKGMLGRAVQWRIEERGTPFRGLLAFEADHADVFFGRNAEIERGRERLADAAAGKAPFLLLLGASGSGKSSLARAGLIPRLIAPGAVAGVDLWRTARFAVGHGDVDPLHALAAALLDGEALPELAGSPSPTAESIATQLAIGGETAVGLVRWALDRAAEKARVAERYDRPVVARLVLLADQFEGLFAGAVSAERRSVFVAALDALVRSGLAWTIATLRSTDYAPLQAEATLLKLKEEGATLDLVPPEAVALAEMIHGPAAAAGLAFERDAGTGRGLDEILRADALGSGGVADALPLLQFTLQNLFEARELRDGVPTLTLAAYAALGGIEGAIAAEAERAVSALPKTAQEQLPWLLRQLATAGRQDQAVVLRDMALDDAELAHRSGAAALIDALVGARVMVLVAGAGQGRGRLAHEAVLRRWERARTYVESNARFFRQRAALQTALERWEGDGRSRDSLLRGTPLATAEDLVGIYGAELPQPMRDFVDASRRAANRGRHVAYAIAAGMAVLFVGAAAGGLYALQQRAVAERERAEAQRNFEAARKTADTLVLDLAFGLRDSGGLKTATVRKILDGAEKTYDQLASVASDNVDLLSSQARMQMAFADTYAAQGDTQHQAKAALAALAIMQRLVAQDQGRVGWQDDLSIAYERVGDVLVAQGHLGDALKAYRDALAIRERVTKSDVGNASWQRDLSIAYGKVGDVLKAQGNLGDALKAYRDSLAIRERLAKSDVGNAGWQRDLSVSYDKVGNVLVAQGHLGDALKAYRDCLAISERLAKSDVGNAGWQRDLSVSYNRVGDVLVAQGHLGDALKAYRDSLAIRERLAKSDVGNAGWQRDLSVSYDNVGNVLLAQGNFDDALKAYRDDLAIIERLAKSDVGNAGWQRDLSIAYGKVGDVLKAQGNLGDALKAYRDSLAISERLAALDPTNSGWQFDVVASQWRLAEQGDEPVRRWELIVDTLRKMHAEGRLTPPQEKWLPEAEAELKKAKGG